MNTHPLVSVVIPTFEGEKFLDSSIRSVLDQTYKNIEVIVVDDGSNTGGTKVICDSYAGKVVYIHQKNSGPSAARNAGIKASRGDYIAFNDDDDLWMPRKIEKQMDRLLALEAAGVKVGLVYAGIQFINEAGGHRSRMLYRSAGHNYRNLCFNNFVGPPCSVIVTRRALDDVGLFDEDIRGPQDFDLWVRIAEKYELHSVDEFLACYRSNDDQISKDPGIMTKGEEMILKKILRAGALSESDERSLEALFSRTSALRWKNAAYGHLFRGDGLAFRNYMKTGMSMDRSVFGWRAQTYYGLAHICPGGFKWFGRLKRTVKRDVIENVATARMEDRDR